MNAFLKIIRFPNLLIIATTQVIIRHFIVQSMLRINGFQLQFPLDLFILLIISTLLIAAAGYMINDYFDEKVDSINKPDQVIIGKKIGRNTIYNLYYIFNFAAILMGFYITFKIDMTGMSVVFILIPGLLWFYSTTYKNQLIIGNLIVALITSLVPLITGVFELIAINLAYQEVLVEYGINFNAILYWVMGYSFFAFIITFCREIIKDAEDFEGDVLTGRYSMPAAIGIKGTKIFLLFLLAMIIASLVWVYRQHINDAFTFWYLTFFIALPLAITGYYIVRARSKKDFHIASILSKIVMITGITYGIAVKYIIKNL